jgi:hypothetical protein
MSEYHRAEVTVRFTLDYTDEFDYCEMMTELRQRLQEQAGDVEVLSVERRTQRMDEANP